MIGDMIKQKRLNLELTLEDVARALNVSKSTVLRYETKEIENMGIDKIEALAKVLNCSPLDILGYSKTSQIELNEPEQNHVKKYRKLDAHGKEVIDLILDSEVKRIDSLAQEGSTTTATPKKALTETIAPDAKETTVVTPSKQVPAKPSVKKEPKPYVPNTLAAHYDGNELTEEALNDIARFVQIVAEINTNG